MKLLRTRSRPAPSFVAAALVGQTLLLCAPAARGHPAPAPAMVPVAPPPSSAELAAPHLYGSRLGFALQIGGGFQEFTNRSLRDSTATGASWDVRLIGGTHALLGFELAYIGATRQFTPLGRTSTSSLFSTGGQAALRLNAPIVRGRMLFEPFGFVGLGWEHYAILDYSAAFWADFTATDDVLTIPFGGGLAFADRALLLDVRASYTPTYDNDMVRGGSGLDHWGVSGHVGLAF